MKTLYMECNMGAAGDMLMAALCELLDEPEDFIRDMNAMGLPGVRFERSSAEKCGIIGTRIRVTVNGEEEHSFDADGQGHHDHDHHHDHPHTGLDGVRMIIDGLAVSDRVKADAVKVYEKIARAESEVHGRPVDQVHFHEVGALDAIADVVGVCALMERLNPGCVVISPVHVGSGQVRCAHGVLPVPAPATALLLEGVPIYGGAIRGELCTPTGAALLTHFADRFSEMPVMAVQKIGYGMGSKDFEWANCVRAMLGEAGDSGDTVSELSCNLDDMTAEETGFAMQALREAGALEVYTLPVQMKKDRPGTLLCCLCLPERESAFAELMLKHTTTLGVRCRTLRRYTLQREAVTLSTPYGPVRGKRSRGYGIERIKPEYDDLAAIARREGVALRDIRWQAGEERKS